MATGNSAFNFKTHHKVYNEKQFKELLLESIMISIRNNKNNRLLETKDGRKRYILFTITDLLEVSFPIDNVNINFSDSPDNLNRIANELSEYTYDELYTFAYL